jgi:hypothetical protein
MRVYRNRIEKDSSTSTWHPILPLHHTPSDPPSIYTGRELYHVAETTCASRESGLHHFLRRICGESASKDDTAVCLCVSYGCVSLETFPCLFGGRLDPNGRGNQSTRTRIALEHICSEQETHSRPLDALARQLVFIVRSQRNTFTEEKNENTILYESAGFAVTRSRAFPLGEKAFVKALYFGDESNMWDLESKEYPEYQEGQCLDGLYYLYQWRREVHGQDRNTIMSCAAEKIGVAFATHCNPPKVSCAKDNPVFMVLKPKFHAKKAAKRSLTAACRYPDVHSFRKEVISCLITRFRPEMLAPNLRDKDTERDEDVLRDVLLSRD